MRSTFTTHISNRAGLIEGDTLTGAELGPHPFERSRDHPSKPEAAASEGFSSDDSAQYQALSALLPYFEEGRWLSFWAASGAWDKLKSVGLTICMGSIPAVVLVFLLPESWRQDYALLLILGVIVMVTMLGVFLQWRPIRRDHEKARLLVKATYLVQIGTMHVGSLQQAISSLLDFEQTMTEMYQQSIASLQGRLGALNSLAKCGQLERAGLREQLRLYFERFGEEEDNLLTQPLERLDQIIEDIASSTDGLLQGDFSASQLVEIVQTSTSLRKQIEEVIGALRQTLADIQLMPDGEQDL